MSLISVVCFTSIRVYYSSNNAWALPIIQVSTPGILNCNEMLPFWLSWNFGYIKVGRGRIVDEQAFMTWQDPDPMSVSLLSITTGWDSTGIWHFANFEGIFAIIKYLF